MIMIRTAALVSPCRIPISSRVSARRARTLSTGITAMSKQDKAAEIIRDAVDEKIGKDGVDLKGTPEEVAEKLIKDEGGDEIKERELKRNDRHQVDGVAGSGLERGEASAVAQSAVDRASKPKKGATVMPEAAEKAKEMLADEIREANK